MKTRFLIVALLMGPALFAQESINLYDLQPDVAFDNVHVQKLSSDSLVSSFVVWVKREVKLHHHQFHTETLLVLEGSGKMTIGDEVLDIGPGDFLAIPKTAQHAVTVTSEVPLKALSVQAPEFLGKDRIYAGQLKRPKN